MKISAKNMVFPLPLLMPIQILLVYAFLAADYRVLIWAWTTGYAPFWIMFASLSALALVAMVCIMKLWRFGYTIMTAGNYLALAYNSYLVMWEKKHSTLVLVFVLFALGVLAAEKVGQVLKQPYYDSRRRWWESFPKKISNLEAELGDGAEFNKKLSGRLSNFGSEGCFFFSETARLTFVPTHLRILSTGKELLTVRVSEMVRTRDSFGVGLRFNSEAAHSDWSKDLQDYIGQLRRSGHEMV